MLSVMGRGMARGDRAAEKKGTACARRGSLGEGPARRGDVFGRAAYTAGSSPNHWQIAS